MSDVASGELASWVQAGGVVAFATAVLFELRAVKPVLVDLKVALSALLERERIRAERRREASGQHRLTSKPEWSDDETTDVHALMRMQQKRGKTQPGHRQVTRGDRPDRPFDDE